MIGQTRIQNLLAPIIVKCKREALPFPHTILNSGRGGMGKTTLIQEVAEKLGRKLYIVSALGLKTDADFIALLEQVKPLDIIFIDEFEASRKLDLRIRPLIENSLLDIGGKTWHFPKLTFMIATNDISSLSNPLRNRFALSLFFDDYEPQDLENIARLYSAKNKIELTDGALNAIIDRANGVPRNLVHFCEILALYEDEKPAGSFKRGFTEKVLAKQGFYEGGIDSLDVRILQILDKHGSVSFQNMLNLTSETKLTISQRESILLNKKYITITPRGRKITFEGKEFLGKI